MTGTCRACDITQIYPRGIYSHKEQGYDLRVDIRRLLGYFSKYPIKCSVFFVCFFFHLLYVITKNPQYARKSKLYTNFEAEIIILEIKFYKGAKRLRGERGSGRNDSGAKGKVGETTRGRNSGRKGKWAKRLGGERESGRNDPDSYDS